MGEGLNTRLRGTGAKRNTSRARVPIELFLLDNLNLREVFPLEGVESLRGTVLLRGTGMALPACARTRESELIKARQEVGA